MNTQIPRRLLFASARDAARLAAAILTLSSVAATTALAQLQAVGSQQIAQGQNGLEGTVERFDKFGKALAKGDFNNDGLEDLVVGVPREDSDTDQQIGVVQVIYGQFEGLGSFNNQLWFQGFNGLPGTAEAQDRFGQAVAAGDFNGDGYDDLAAGAPLEDLDALTNAGAVLVWYGGPAGLTSINSQLWTQDSPDILGVAEEDDRFGNSLTVGDFNGDSRMDLAIGAFEEDIDGFTDAGVVHVLYGAPGGLSATGNQIWYQGSTGIPGTPEDFDRFATSLAAGPINNDPYDDLVVGIPDENLGDLTDAGAIQVFFGASTGLVADNAVLIDQSNPNVEADAEAGDNFGFKIAIGSFNGDEFNDLAVSAPQEDIGLIANAGAVFILLTGESGIATTSEVLHQDVPGVLESAGADEFFGYALAVGDFDVDGLDDLAIGVPDQNILVDLAGQVQVFYGSRTGLNNPKQQLWSQNTPGIEGVPEEEDFFGEALVAGRFSGGPESDLAIGIPGENVNQSEDAGAVSVIYGTVPALLFADGFETFGQ